MNVVELGQRRGEPGVSVIVPLSERPVPLGPFYEEFAAPFAQAELRFEFIFVVEAWRSELVEPLDAQIREGAPIRVLEVGQVAPEATLIEVGVAHTRFETIVVLPPYPRVVPDALPELVARLDDGFDLVSARREPRRDPWPNRLQGLVFRMLLRHTVWVPFRDVGSGVRAFRREVLEEVPLYADFARFLPVLAVRAGFRVDELPVPQHPGDRARRVYGPGTYLRRLIDLVGLGFLVRFTRKPLRFFGLMGAGLAGAGALILLVVAVQRFGGQPAADRPVLLLGVLMLVLGTQSIGLGLIGELIVHFRAAETRGYRLAQVKAHPSSTGLDGSTDPEAAATDAHGEPSPPVHRSSGA